MADNGRDMVEGRNVTMYPVHWATVEALAKDGGYPSLSAALRRIIDEWLEAKRFQTLARSVLRAQLVGAITADEAVGALISHAGLRCIIDESM